MESHRSLAGDLLDDIVPPFFGPSCDSSIHTSQDPSKFRRDAICHESIPEIGPRKRHMRYLTTKDIRQDTGNLSQLAYSINRL